MTEIKKKKFKKENVMLQGTNCPSIAGLTQICRQHG